ncbi:hypothetical protein [Stappia sp.]|uniref:hypothetical protein n=1 Tax=Stappia sp. TaxID=1870903 RepID=UPI0032D8DA2E
MWMSPASPWSPYLDRPLSALMRDGQARAVEEAIRQGRCDEVRAMETAAVARAHADLRVAFAEADVAELFQGEIYPFLSQAYPRCRALALIGPLVGEARRMSDDVGFAVTAREVQFFIETGRHDAIRPVELDTRVLSSAVSTLEVLATCHHDPGALADLLRLEPHLGDLKAAGDRGIYLVRLAEALGVGDPAGFEPLPEVRDARDRARIARIDRTFADMPVAEAVRVLPYRSDACRLLPVVLEELYRPVRARLVPPSDRLPGSDEIDGR